MPSPDLIGRFPDISIWELHRQTYTNTTPVPCVCTIGSPSCRIARKLLSIPTFNIALRWLADGLYVFTLPLEWTYWRIIWLQCPIDYVTSMPYRSCDFDTLLAINPACMCWTRLNWHGPMQRSTCLLCIATWKASNICNVSNIKLYLTPISMRSIVCISFWLTPSYSPLAVRCSVFCVVVQIPHSFIGLGTWSNVSLYVEINVAHSCSHRIENYYHRRLIGLTLCHYSFVYIYVFLPFVAYWRTRSQLSPRACQSRRS